MNDCLIFFQGFQMLNQQFSYIDFTNAVELSLYVLTLILSLNFENFSLESISELTNGQLTTANVSFFAGLQDETGLRLVGNFNLSIFDNILNIFRAICTWSNSSAFVFAVGGLRFKSRTCQFGHSLTNSSLPLRHFFGRSYMYIARRHNNLGFGRVNSLNARL